MRTLQQRSKAMVEGLQEQGLLGELRSFVRLDVATFGGKPLYMFVDGLQHYPAQLRMTDQGFKLSGAGRTLKPSDLNEGGASMRVVPHDCETGYFKTVEHWAKRDCSCTHGAP